MLKKQNHLPYGLSGNLYTMQVSFNIDTDLKNCSRTNNGGLGCSQVNRTTLRPACEFFFVQGAKKFSQQVWTFVGCSSDSLLF